MKTTKYFLIILLLSGLASCGDGETGNSDEFDREDEVLPEPETLQKIYRTDLRPVNPTLESQAEGQAIVRLEDDSFEVNIAMRNVPELTHRQHIRTGKDCPTTANDTNRDGVIDLAEAEAISGNIFIPLDDNLDELKRDNDTYPNGGFLKAYAYREDTTRTQLVRELGVERNIQFGNRVILVLGAEENENIPLACGELTPVIGSE